MAKFHTASLRVSQSRPKITLSTFGVTKKVAGSLMPLTTTISSIMPSVIRLVLVTASNGYATGDRFFRSTIWDGIKLTVAPLSSKQFFNCPPTRSERYAAEDAFTGSLEELWTGWSALASVRWRFLKSAR